MKGPRQPQFTKLPNEFWDWLCGPRFDPIEKAVLFGIAEQLYRWGRITVDASRKDMAESACVSSRKVVDVLKVLELSGLVHVERTQGEVSVIHLVGATDVAEGQDPVGAQENRSNERRSREASGHEPVSEKQQQRLARLLGEEEMQDGDR